jgi:Ni,Fe-hydrogenase III large subunit/Ni,Fe-hydrogenase III component G
VTPLDVPEPVTVPGLAPCGLHRSAARVEPSELVEVASALLADGMRLALVSGHDDGTAMRVVYLFTSGPPDRRIELHVPVDRTRPELPTLAGTSFPASRFERELQDLFGIEPLDHPQPRRLVLHQHWPVGWHPMRSDAGPPPAMVDEAGPYPFVPVEGTGVYEIPVGPVHAGLIEPGHFRFWVVGETILRMKARLWFVHKGIERLFEGKTIADGLAIAERISGDTAVGHGIAYCQAVEDALGVELPPEAQILRAVLLEMERIYNHVADIGALCNDVGFGLANAWALSLREHLLQLNHDVTGHRLLRGGTAVGGATVRRLPSRSELEEIAGQFDDLAQLADSNAFVMERFSGTATLDRSHARDLGLVGVAARASGVTFDARTAHPFVELGGLFTPVTHDAGDVMARYRVRVDEVRAALHLLGELIGRSGPGRSTAANGGRPVADRSHGGVGVVEGWRGVVVHRIELGADGTLARVKVVDPSFLNWPGLPVSLADTIVPDFPLANKSFNLSYAGNDL